MKLHTVFKNILFAYAIIVTFNTYTDGESPFTIIDTEKSLLVSMQMLSRFNDETQQKDFLIRLPLDLQERMVQEIAPEYPINHTISLLDNLADYFKQFND